MHGYTHIYRKVDIQAGRQIYRQTDKQIYRQTHTQRYILHMYTHACMHTHTHTRTRTHTHTYIYIYIYTCVCVCMCVCVIVCVCVCVCVCACAHAFQLTGIVVTQDSSSLGLVVAVFRRSFGSPFTFLQRFLGATAADIGHGNRWLILSS